jgi:aryl-phospho-beta-D-glucosidase BglC (GH1 family)
MFSEEDTIFSVCTALISVKLFFSIINTIPFSVIYQQRVTTDLFHRLQSTKFLCSRSLLEKDRMFSHLCIFTVLVYVTTSSSSPVPSDYHNGVSFGGWLLTEPSWMYDQFNAPAEADLIAKFRAQGGDEFAVTSMKNHWAGYIPDEALDTIASFGITHTRLPIGYWIMESPVDVVIPTSRGGPYDYGFNHEGFVTGGLNHLESTIAKLKARGIHALIDVHAMPGGSSSCQSYSGWQVNSPLFWTDSPPPSNATIIPSACNGAGPYRTSRGNAKTWMQVGEDILLSLATWIKGLENDPTTSGTVVGLEVVNEPGLGFNGVQPQIEKLLTEIVPSLQSSLSDLNVNVTLNFIGGSDNNAGAWVASQIKSGLFNASRLLIDYHQYFNWDGSLSWEQLAANMCSMSNSTSTWSQYTDAGLPVVIGEWSCSTNLGAKAFTDLTNPDIVSHLRTLYANQMSLFSAHGGDSPNSVGQHHWALRMGSGWDPRPSSENPTGGQVSGSAWDTSIQVFGPAVWNLGELIRVGVAQPLKTLNVSGVCVCNSCSKTG